MNETHDVTTCIQWLSVSYVYEMQGLQGGWPPMQAEILTNPA